MDIFFNLRKGPSLAHANLKQFNNCFIFLTLVLADYFHRERILLNLHTPLGRFKIPKDVP